MPAPVALELAQLREIFLDKTTGRVDPDRSGQNTAVQFNPETLNLKHSKSSLRGDATAHLSVSLVFDVTALDRLAAGVSDVQELTRKLDYYVTSQKPGPWTHGVRFLWGSFKFDGWISSVDKTFDSFAADGTPLRATVAIAISSDGIIT